MITCEASHVIWVNNVRVGRISNSTGDADPLQCATPEESCEVLADDIRKCNSYQTCGITQIAADSAECLHGGFVYDTNFMEITHTCIEGKWIYNIRYRKLYEHLDSLSVINMYV